MWDPYNRAIFYGISCQIFERSCYLCAVVIDFATLCAIFRLDFGTVTIV